MSQKMIIQGGSPLRGCIRLGGAKNASYKLMIAALLGTEESRLLNVPEINDVHLVKECIELLGGKADHVGNKTYIINPNITTSSIPEEFGPKSRASHLFIAPLLAKHGRVTVPMPGGDKLGNRPLDRTMDGLEAMGAQWSIAGNMVTIQAPQGLHGTTYRFSKNSHTGTEVLMMAATLAKGTTILENAAMEPEIDDMIDFLNAMGAKIRRRAFRTIEIVGVDTMKGAIHSVIPDRNVAVTYACAAILSKGDIIIENARHQDLTAFLEKLDEAGGGYEIGDWGMRFYRKGPLRATDVETKPEPGFMTDWHALWAVLMCSAEGTSIIHETIYPSRFNHYVQILEVMGATFETFDPQVDHPDKVYNFNWSDEMEGGHYAIKIHGPTSFSGGEFAMNDLRAGAAVLLAAIAGSGETVLTNIEQIDRGYESIDQHLVKMGADITRE